MKKMSWNKTFHMRTYPFVFCCMAILLAATACGKNAPASITGNWKQVFAPGDLPLIPGPLVITTTDLILRSDQTFKRLSGKTVIDSGTYHIEHVSNPTQQILYFSNNPDGSRISFSRDTLKLTFLGPVSWTPTVSKYLRN